MWLCRESLEDRKIILCSILNDQKKNRKAWTSHTVKQYYSSFYDRFLLQPYFPSTIDFSSTPPLRSLLLSSQQFSAENDECVIRTCETTDAQLSQFITLNDANASSIIELWSFSDILLHAEQLRFRQRDVWECLTGVMTADCDNVQFILHNFILFFFIRIMTTTTVMPAGWKLVGDVMQYSDGNVLRKKKIISKFQIFFGSCLRALLQNCRS